MEKDTAVSFRPSSGNGELPRDEQGGTSARGSRRTTAGSRPNSRRSTLGELASVKGGRRDTQEAAAAVCSQQVAAALHALLMPADVAALPEDAALITSSPSLPTPCEEKPQAQAEVEPEEEAPPPSPRPELPKDAAPPSTSTALIVYRPANTVIRAAPPKSAAVNHGPLRPGQADGEMVIKLIYQPYVDNVMGPSVRVTGTGTLTGQALARIAAEEKRAKHTVELVPGKGPGPWALPQAANHTVELVPGKGPGPWAPMAEPHAAVKTAAPCTAVIPYRGNKPAVPAAALKPPSPEPQNSPAETMVSLCNRFVAEANSAAAKPYLFRDNLPVPGRSIDVGAALAMLPSVHVEPPAAEKQPAACTALIVYQGNTAAAPSRAQHPWPGSSSLTIEHEGFAETMTSTRSLHAAAMPSCNSPAAADDSTAMMPYRPCDEVVVAAALQAVVDAALLAAAPISDVQQASQPSSTRPFTGQFRHMLWLQKKKKKSVYRSPSISVDWGAKGRLGWKLWAFKQARRARGGEGKAVDWGAPGRPNPALWPRKRAVFQAPSIAVDWSAVSRPNPNRWPRKRAIFRAPSIAVDWSAAEVPACWLWEQKVAARGLGEDAADAVDWSGAGVPAVMAWQQRLAAVGSALQGLLGQVGRACARLFQR